MAKAEVKNKYEEVKATLGYDMPLSSDTYSKEKASLYISFTIGGDELNMKEYRKVVKETVKDLAKGTEELLIEKGQNMIDKIVEEKVKERTGIDGKTTDELRIELSQQYSKDIENAKKVIKALKQLCTDSGVEVDMQEILKTAGVESK
jgi:hypothetical protein